MWEHITHLSIPKIESSALVILLLILLNLAFNVLANASFRVSALSESWQGVLTWQVIGNLAGFITVLTLTGLLKYLPLHVAFPVTTGLAIIGVQLVAARWIFHEAITNQQWLGTLAIVLGIWLIQR